MLRELFARQQAILGYRMLAMYLDGSLTTGDFDQDSDIDFVVVTRGRVSAALFAELQAMHDALAQIDSVWAIQLEGSYMPARALRRYNPADARQPNLERGLGERLKWADHDITWDLHRYVLRQRGIPLLGPPAVTLIDPVAPDALRAVMRENLRGWAERLLMNLELMRASGYQSFVVLSICRILYTLETADVVSKAVAARWAQSTLDGRWRPLIERAWYGRSHPDQPADLADIVATQDFIRYARLRAGMGEK